MLNSLVEADIIPVKVFQLGLTRAFLYNGPSMQPTFQPGQILYSRPGIQNLKPGDILVYEKAGKNIVHRLYSIERNGYTLRGDNNRLQDANLVTQNQVLGRVEMVGDGHGIHLVLSGRSGFWLARLWWVYKYYEQPIRLVLGWPYRFVKSRGWVTLLWRPEFQLLQLGQGEASVVKYLFHDRTVAVWDAALNHFTCHKPFDLVLQPPKTENKPN
jgi:signal peptidase I